MMLLLMLRLVVFVVVVTENARTKDILEDVVDSNVIVVIMEIVIIHKSERWDLETTIDLC